MKLIAQHTVISLLVKDQEAAFHFYTAQLGLEKRSDIQFGPGLRLLTVAPPGQHKPELALAQPDQMLYGEEHIAYLLAQQRQRISSVFVTDNCTREYATLKARGVTFTRAPSQQRYGIEATFSDPEGNVFTLLETTPEILALFNLQQIHSAA